MLSRADQLLSRFGYCSRREAVDWIQAGRITLASPPGSAGTGQEPGPGSAAADTVVTRPDQRVAPESVLVDGEPVEFPCGLLVLLHKPIGYACSHDPAESPVIYSLLPPRWLRRNPVPSSIGRLDRDTSGLLLITDDGALAHRLTSPKHEVEKCYEVTVSTPLPAGLTELFAAGTLVLKGEPKPCRPARLEITGDCTARIFLHEGKYHQVRRMFASQGCPVTALHRSAFGNLTLGDLPAGQWRPLDAAELD